MKMANGSSVLLLKCWCTRGL